MPKAGSAASRRTDAKRDGRRKLLTAAAEVFAEKGYADTTTKEIAQRARVTEPMLFRHYGSKAGLFQAAAVAPFAEYMTSYCSKWERRGLDESDEGEVRLFYTGLYRGFLERRELLVVALASEPATGATGPIGQVVQDAMDRSATLQARERDTRGLPQAPYDFPIMIRLMFGLVLSVGLHGEWLFGAGLDEDRVLDEMARLTICGGGTARAMAPARRPAPSATTRRRRKKDA
ncbi:TetR/AcrR family transcriptional regulator [Mycobacterium marseillense]|uniref:TetR/AcrR family transcriptional regulator n=1 Tax=Mycobacterium marseillense TaxID=701042 RepID=UPI0015D34279|nr:TetR/AcrR family transcriptional regulator [Mycobacterium marseillense]